MSFKKSAERITYLYNTYRKWDIIPKCCIKELESLCSYKCLSCNNSFINKGWCPTKIKNNCLYFEKKKNIVKEDIVEDDINDITEYNNMDYYKAIGIYREKGFITRSLLQRRLKIDSRDARFLLDKLKCELGDNIGERI